MTILPELRDALARAEPSLILPELRDGLVRARPRRAWRRRPVLAGGVALGGLLVTAGAWRPPACCRAANRSSRGTSSAIRPTVSACRSGSTARLLPLRVPDPAGGPPWGLRMVTTSRGLACLQLGRVVGDQLGVLRQGIARNDGRFHPLPVATASTPTHPLPGP